MQLTTHPLAHLPIRSTVIWQNIPVQYWGIEYYLSGREPIYRILVVGEEKYRSVQFNEIKIEQ